MDGFDFEVEVGQRRRCVAFEFDGEGQHTIRLARDLVRFQGRRRCLDC